MPAITLGYSQIEQQIRIIRRRRNWLTLQQAIYSCGGVMLLGIALLILLAIRGERLVFSIAFWVTVISVLLSAVAGTRSIWQRWIRQAETVRWIDRVARLDDRLATLVAHHGATQPPRLLTTLISQLFALRYRWEPTTLVPRRVSRSVYFFVAAVVALIATTFVERPPATPQRFPKVTAPHPNGPPDAHGGRVVRLQGQPAANDEGLQMGGGDGDDSASGRAHKSDGRSGKNGPGGRAREGQATKRGARAPSADAQTDPEPPPALPERVQDMIRQALSHPPLDTERARAGAERAQGKSGPAEEKGSKGGEQQQARAEGVPNRDAGEVRPNAATTPQQPRDNAEGSRGTSSGGGGGQGTGNIYGEQPAAIVPEKADKTFALKLVLMGQTSRATMEPQKSKRGGVSDLGTPRDQPTSDVPLNPNQRSDEPLVRGEIPAEHEAMIKRIFSQAE